MKRKLYGILFAAFLALWVFDVISNGWYKVYWQLEPLSIQLYAPSPMEVIPEPRFSCPQLPQESESYRYGYGYITVYFCQKKVTEAWEHESDVYDKTEPSFGSYYRVVDETPLAISRLNHNHAVNTLSERYSLWRPRTCKNGKDDFGKIVSDDAGHWFIEACGEKEPVDIYIPRSVVRNFERIRHERRSP